MNQKTIDTQEKNRKHKRGWHQGTLKKLPNGKFQIWISLPNGQRKSKTCKSEAECNRWASQIQGNPIFENRALHSQRSTQNSGLNFYNPKTVAQWFEEWLPKAKMQVRESTFRDYTKLSHQYIIPRMGNLKLHDLSRKKVNAFYETLDREGVGRNTIKYIHRVFHRAMQIAYIEEEVLTNPVHGTNIPRVEEKEMRFLNEPQVLVFLASLNNHPHEALFDLAVKSGPREGELLGLKWEDIDFFRGTISFQRQARRIDGKGLQLRPLKTKASKRTIHVGANTLDLLAKHKDEQEKLKHLVGNSWIKNDLVFPTNIGTIFDQSNLVAEFKAVLELAGLPEIRFHDLRHTAASVMIKNGIDIITVSRTLGHSRASTTLNIYGHLMPGIQPDAAQKIDNALTPTPIDGLNFNHYGIAKLTETEQNQSLAWARKKSQKS